MRISTPDARSTNRHKELTILARTRQTRVKPFCPAAQACLAQNSFLLECIFYRSIIQIKRRSCASTRFTAFRALRFSSAIITQQPCVNRQAASICTPRLWPIARLYETASKTPLAKVERVKFSKYLMFLPPLTKTTVIQSSILLILPNLDGALVTQVSGKTALSVCLDLAIGEHLSWWRFRRRLNNIEGEGS
jgi:hypothetical protein